MHCFEPNPVVALEAETLKKIANDAGLFPSNLIVHQKAIFDREGVVEFASIGGFPRGLRNGRGQSSSIVGVGQKDGVVAKNMVPCVDLLSFVRSLALTNDDVYIKLDIEGAEFATLKHLLTNGNDVLPSIKKMWIEWHDRYFNPGSWERDKAVNELTTALRSHNIDVHVWR